MFSLDILPNKTRVLLAPLKETQAVTVLVLVKVGSRYEPPNLNGISHFIEHLLFKGTTKRPTSLDITKELDGVGADFNAFTGKDHTGYYVKVNHDKLELALEIVADMLFNSLFKKKEIEKERGVIMEEINMYDDNPLLDIGNFFEKIIFSGNSLGNYIPGPKKNIKAITRGEIINYFNSHYRSGNLLVGLSGCFETAKTKRLIKKYFSFVGPAVKKTTFSKFSPTQTKPRVQIKTKTTEQVQLALGYPAYRLNDPKIYPLNILNTILGGNMSSRLFLEIREKLGLAYYIRSYLTSYEDTGTLTVFAGLDKSKIELALKVINKELHKVVVKSVSQEELLRAKEFIKGKLILSLEDSATRIQWLATQQLLQKKIQTLEQQLKKIDQVTVNHVQKVAKEVINKSRVNLAVIGPYKDQKKFLNYLT